MSRTKMFLWLLGIPFVLLQTYWTFAPEVGIIARYGFFDGFTQYFALNWGNSLLMAGITDFMTVVIISMVWMITETPVERRWKGKFWVWMVSFIVFPGLGFLMFFLFLNPDQRFVRN